MIKLVLDIPDIVEKIMPTSVKVDGQDKPVYFIDGTPYEVIHTLVEKDASESFKFKKYPLIILFHDITQVVEPRPGVWADLMLNLAIVNYTEREYTSKQRREVNYKPILRPIYKDVINAFEKSPFFMGFTDSYRHQMTERMFWGRKTMYGNEGEILNDHLDGIDIENLKLSLDKKTCEKWLIN
ncbi:MAG TPA: hypothetical protein VHA52_08735 [Candidatus Babeliaceae bacterium]|nr:hypothetical protein [Candidatus Babeliaceae bacterium]